MASVPRVLIVEDDPETRHSYTEAFARGGFNTEQAHNGHQALAQAFTTPYPDLILTDIAVPGLDGIELCRQPRADARTRRIPVLAITGYEDRRYPDRMMDAGANYVLVKPCDSDVLVNEARRLLSKSALRNYRRRFVAQAFRPATGRPAALKGCAAFNFATRSK